MKTQNSFNIEYLNAGILLALAIWIWTYSSSFPSQGDGYPGAALFPRVIAIGFALGGLVLMWQAFRSQTSEEVGEKLERKGLLKLGAAIGMIALLPSLASYIGLMISIGLAVAGMALLLNIIHWKSALIAVCTASGIYLMFNQLLGVPL